MQAPIALIAVDLDRTLLRTDKSISPYTLDIWERCREQGILLAVATARYHLSARRYLELLRPHGLVSSSGAGVWCGERALCSHTIPTDTALALAECWRQNPDILTVTAQCEDGYYSTRDLAELPGDFAHALPWDLGSPLPSPAYQFTVQYRDRKAVEAMAARFPRCRVAFFHDEDWCSFLLADVNKLAGLVVLAKHLNIPLSAVAAFGDDISDLEMVAACGWGTAVSNAIPPVLQAAAFTTLSNDEDGVARFLDGYLHSLTPQPAPAQS